MMISTSCRCVYVAVPKCGSQAIYAWLERHCDGERYGQVNEQVVPTWARNYYRWTVVRNPYARAVSLWWSTTQREQTIDRYGFRACCPEPDNLAVFINWICDMRDQTRAGRQVAVNHDPLSRTMDEQLRPAKPFKRRLQLQNLWPELLTLPWLSEEARSNQVGRVNQTAHLRPPVKDIYESTRGAIEAVIRWAPEDFAQFGYRLDSWEWLT